MTGADESVTAHLGPMFNLRQENVRVPVDDSLTVRGSHVTMRGEPSMIVAELTMREQTWTLWDEEGFPAWRGQRRQN